MNPSIRVFSLIATCSIVSLSSAPGDDAGIDFYNKEVEPILAENCFRCHGNGKAKGGLNLYTRENVLKGGESGPGIDLESPELSMILDAVNYTSYEMPPSGQLPQDQISIIEKWVKLGAPMPERTDVKEIHAEGPPAPVINEQTKNHWAFRPLHAPDVPHHDQNAFVQSPIDAFTLTRLQGAGLKPNPAADKVTLVRRLHYTLTGLPPTSQQVDEFLADDSPEAFEDLVDELLQSPHFGEHWARYWLDLVRYAESNSFERDNPKPFVWKYRDYVIRSFNNDKPYDQFVMEQLAGDELDEVTSDSIIATGYYRLGQWDDEPADPQLAMFDELDDIIATTSQGLLGLSMNCARCHDHKLDPIPQVDYYRMLAFFRNIKRYGIRSDQSVYENSLASIATEEEAARHAEVVAQHEARVEELRTKLDVLEERIREQLQGGEKDDFQADSVRRRIIQQYVGKYLTQAEFEEYSNDRKEWTDLRNNPPKSADLALAVKEYGMSPLDTHILIRGNPTAEGDVVTPAFPEVLTATAPAIKAVSHSDSSGRRLALARWITDRENGLPTRVIVNRIWQWTFGRGLVRTPNNLGLTGDAPTHPELLEWLSIEFQKDGESIKSLVKKMLMSSTWQMSSSPQDNALAQDPLNDLYWRFDMRRLRAEEIRDSILAANGTINLKDFFGPSIYPKIPEAVLAGQSRPGQGWENSPPEQLRRRSVYIHIKRSLTVPLLAAFDSADTDFTCPVRFATTQPTQALGMLNSDFLNEQAEVFAQELQTESPNNLQQQVEIALERVTQRHATVQEVARGLALIESLKIDYNQDERLALKNFCLVALNFNEFIYLD